MYRLKDLMEMLNIPERTIRRHISDGILKGEKVGGSWRFSLTNLQNYLDNPKIRLSNQKTSTKEVIDFMNGFRKDKNDIVLIMNIERAKIDCSENFSKLVNNSKKPFYFNISIAQKKSIITFIGNPIDAIPLLEERERIND